jgi:isocitrate/isopropylmalate dehydrogenase
VAEFAFQQARKMRAKVFGGPKFTVSPTYEGLFKEELDRAAARYPDVRYEPQLIDATYALLIKMTGDSMVIPTLNRDGDCMSDLVLGLFGSIAGAESLVFALDDQYHVKTVMAEAPHGTAPALFGKNIANPMAMILAGAAVLSYLEEGDDKESDRASRALYESCLETVYDGIATPDLGGHATTTEFTDEVIARTKKKLEIWRSLG